MQEWKLKICIFLFYIITISIGGAAGYFIGTQIVEDMPGDIDTVKYRNLYADAYNNTDKIGIILGAIIGVLAAYIYTKILNRLKIHIRTTLWKFLLYFFMIIIGILIGYFAGMELAEGMQKTISSSDVMNFYNKFIENLGLIGNSTGFLWGFAVSYAIIRILEFLKNITRMTFAKFLFYISVVFAIGAAIGYIIGAVIGSAVDFAAGKHLAKIGVMIGSYLGCLFLLSIIKSIYPTPFAQEQKRIRRTRDKKMQANQQAASKAKANTETNKPDSVIKSRYKIIKKLHDGGMGRVWIGEDTKLNKKVVIKEALSGTEQSAIFLKKLMDEAQILKKCNHKNIVNYLDSSKDEDKFYLVIEFVQGETMENKFKNFPATEPEIKYILTQVLDALEYLHKHGVIHRDLTPDNIMLNGSNEVTLIDFGAVAVAGGTGTQIGKKYLTAPETMEKGIADERSDVYALGITLAFLLSGKKPQAWMDAKSFLRGKKWNFIEIVEKATNTDPDKRYSSAREFRDALQNA